METYTNPGFWSYFIGSYAFYLPLVLTCIWSPLALFDLSKQKDCPNYKIVLWSLGILLLPVLGGATYLLVEAKSFDSKFRISLVSIGLALFLGVWGLSLVLLV